MDVCDMTDVGADVDDMGSMSLDPNSAMKNRK